MPSLIDFIPISSHTAADVRARIDADVNAGLDPSDSAFADTTPGGFFYDVTQPLVMEIVRLYELASVEVPAAAFPHFCSGDLLDEWGVTLGIDRNPAALAIGEVTFTGDVGTVIPSATEVGVEQVDPDEDPIYFDTVETIILAATPAPTGLGGTPAGSGGALLADIYYYVVTAILADGESSVSEEVAVTTTGSTSKVTLDWDDTVGATSYNVYRGTTAGGERLLASAVAASTYEDTGGATSVTPPPTDSVVVNAVAAGSAGNVAAAAITIVASPIDGISSVTNSEALSGGADVESDELYQARLLLAFKGEGPGTVADYERWAREEPAVGVVVAIPLWDGDGTVQVVICDSQNRPLSQALVDRVQLRLDPIAGEGRGQAPVGVTVTVDTPTRVDIDVSATVTLAAGYTLDGADGMIAIRNDLEGAVEEYINTVLKAGDDVIYNRVLAQYVLVAGVIDVTALTLNATSDDIAIASLEVAVTADLLFGETA